MILPIFNKAGIQIASAREFTFSAEAMGEKKITTTIKSPIKIAFVPFCYVTFKGENYYLQSEAPGKRTAASGYRGDALEYNLTFKSKQTDLVNCDFLDYLLDGGQYYSGMGEFSFYGDVYDLAKRIQANLNIEYTGGDAWTIKMPKTGYSDPQPISSIGISQRSLESENKTITVSDENCWNALTRAYDDYGFNFYLDTSDKSIYIGVTYPQLVVGEDNVVFEYGKGKGLYEINRDIDDSGLITRLRAYGSDKNIPDGYMHTGSRLVTRLQLPSYRDTQSDPVPTDYILASSELIDYYGIRPGKKIFDDIYPTIEGITDGNGHRIDSVHSVEDIIDGTDDNGDYLQSSFWIRLYDMGFDINDLLVSEAAKISMKSGLCASVEFDIVEAVEVPNPGGGDDPDYYSEGVRWKYRLEKNTSYSSNYVLPSGNMLVAPTDTFVILNISMPETYVLAAEANLLTEAQAYLAENNSSKISYSVNLDEIYFANNPLIENVLREGRSVKIIDNDLGDATDDGGLTYYTIKSIQNLTIRYQEGKLLPSYNVTLSESLIASRLDRVDNEISNNAENINQTVVQTGRDRRNAVRNTRNLRALKNYTYDADGYFDVDRIKPLSIETKYLAVGAKSSNFSTNGVKGKTYTDSGYYINITAGFINHREIWWTPNDGTDPLIAPAEGSERYSWAINDPVTFEMTDDDNPYYVFVRANKISGVADWLVTTEQKYYQDTTYFYFQLGTVEKPSEGRRDLILVNGMAFISGGQIYGDNLQSINYTEESSNTGSKYGLNDGTIRIGNTQKGLTYTPADGMKLYGPLAVNPGGNESPVGVYRGAYNAGYTYYNGDEATYGGSLWRYINAASSSGNTPEEGIYWTKIISKGDTGDSGNNGPFIEYRYAKNGSSTTPPDLVNTDLEPAGWTTTVPSVGALEYLWMIKAKKNYEATTLLENWSDPSRMKGNTGDTGAQGNTGPSPVYQGVYDSGTTYYGTSTRVDIVQYSGSYYVARSDAGEFSNVVPTDTAKWNAFGAQFESVATDLLFASLAYIENLGVRYLRTGISPDPRIAINRVINGSTGETSNAIEVFEDGQTDSNTPVIKIDDTAGSEESGYGSTTYPGIEVRKSTVSKLSSIGIFTNGSGHQFLPSSSGITAKAAGVFLGNGNVSGSSNYFAGAYANASNSGTSPTYAMIFGRNILVFGVVDGFMKMPSNRGLYNLPDSDATLSSFYSGDKKYFFWGGSKTTNRTYDLPDPADYEAGEIILFANANDHNSYLHARSGDTINGYAYDARYVTLQTPLDFVELMSDGSGMWRIIRCGGDGVAF